MRKSGHPFSIFNQALIARSLSPKCPQVAAVAASHLIMSCVPSVLEWFTRQRKEENVEGNFMLYTLVYNNNNVYIMSFIILINDCDIPFACQRTWDKSI